jgi:hypothetical protein
MSKYHLQASYKPTKADLKFKRQEDRQPNHTLCFISSSRGAVCATTQIRESKETAHPKYKRAYQGDPKDFFNEAISQISDRCNATGIEYDFNNCTNEKNYKLDYSIKTAPGSSYRLPLYRDVELSVALNQCEFPQKIAGDSQLLNCSKGLLDMAANQSAKSYNLPNDSLPIWAAILLTYAPVGVLILCVYACCCRKPKPTAEQRESQAQYAQPFLNTEQSQARQLARVVPPPQSAVIGPAPRI